MVFAIVFLLFFCKIICTDKKFVIHLHSQKQRNGSVAQLNRVLDYGSSGSRFESWRSHKAAIERLPLFFFLGLSLKFWWSNK